MRADPRQPAVALFSLLAAVAAQDPPQPQAPSAARQRLTLEQTVLGRADAVYFYSSVPEVDWAPDGVHLVADGGDGKVWIDPARGSVRPAPDPLAERRRAFAKALADVPEVGAERAAKIADAASPAAGGRLWALFENDLWAGGDAAPGADGAPDPEGAPAREGAPKFRARRLTRDGVDKLEAEPSPDGRFVAFVREHDLFTVDTDLGVERRLTAEGSSQLRHGRLDWVYQEEVYERGQWKGYWWSPRSDALAFYQLDERPVREYPVVDHIPDPSLANDRAVATELDDYPKAGDPNPLVRIGIAHVGEGRLLWADLSAYDPDVLVVRVGWPPDGSSAVLQVQDRIQTWLDLCRVDPETGAVTRILRESASAAHGWVNVLGHPRWLGDGTFLWLSERTGWKHVFHCAADGKVIAQVTDGPWAVDEILDVDEAGGRLWFSGHKDGAIRRDAYRIGLDGEGLVRLTRGEGTHDVKLSPDRSRFLDEYSSLRTPPELRVCSADGEVIAVLQRGEVPAMAQFAFQPRELLEIPSRDGFVMDAALLKPPDFDPSRRYPIFLDTYSGPGLPSVTDEWNAGADAFHQFLAQQGIAVFQVNNRSSSGKGQVATAACYKSFGAGELRDLEDALDALAKDGWVDGTRVAINGWSYGGTMAAYALTHSKRFALGIAGGGVYDWRLYDSIYTERYMDTPQRNPQGYEQSSCIRAAKDLHGHLVLVHGTMVENVHLQNALHFAWALQEAGKDFELMLYPKSRHGVENAEQSWHLRRLQWRAIREHLLGAR